nr:YqzG/YhdC family protein [Brevibacillus invocatus]
MSFSLVCTNTTLAYNRDIPPYAKWGRIAMEETKKRYPMTEIIDYQHLGRRTINSSKSTETFKLWLRQDSKEWGVWVVITFDPKTDRVLSIRFKELR